MLTITSINYGYIIIKELNLKYNETGNIDENILILSELKSIKNLYETSKIYINQEDHLKVINKIKSLIGLNEPSIHQETSWGLIKGDLINQTDLQDRLEDLEIEIDEKITQDNLSTVATTGDYDDLINKPSLVTPIVNGFMSSADKIKLDGLNELPNNSSSSSSIGGMGFEIGSPISGSIYDNSKGPYYDTHLSDTGSPITVPLFFKETVTISAIGLGIGEGSGGWLSLGIYSSHPAHGYPYQRLWTKENCISAGSVGVRLTTLDFTLEKNNVYWVQITGSYTRLQGLNTTFGSYCIGASTKTGVNPFTDSVENRCHQITSPGSQFSHLKPYFNYTGYGSGTSEQPLDKEGFKNGSRGIPRIFVQVA